MSFLTEKPPEKLIVNSIEYLINADFRTILRYMQAVKEANETLIDVQKCLAIVYKTVPADIA